MTAINSNQLNECFVSATSFLSVAIDLSQDLIGMVAGKMYPCVVNGAFACELFMKALIGASDPNGIPKSHRLKGLFSMLDQKTQADIEAEYLKTSRLPLCDLLDESDNAFIDWRYAYEQGVCSHFTDLIELGKALQKIAQQFI